MVEPELVTALLSDADGISGIPLLVRAVAPANGNPTLGVRDDVVMVVKFFALLFRADCGHKLLNNTNYPNSSIENFNCSNYRGNFYFTKQRSLRYNKNEFQTCTCDELVDMGVLGVCHLRESFLSLSYGIK